MKMVINCSWGGFELPKDYAAVKTNGWVYDCSDEVRCDPDLINIVESEDYEGDLEVVEFSDEATDYMIDEYDGMESLYYVVNGRIKQAVPW